MALPFFLFLLFFIFTLFLEALQMNSTYMHMTMVTSANHFQRNSSNLLKTLPLYDIITRILIGTLIIWRTVQVYWFHMLKILLFFI